MASKIRDFNPSTNIVDDLQSGIKQKIEEYDSGRNRLFKHQYILRYYLDRKIIRDIPRGILLFHELGTGKTITMITIAVQIKRKVLAIMPKMLFANFRKGIDKYCAMNNIRDRAAQEITEMFTFISMDAYNAYKTLSKFNDGNLNGYTILVDEVHELFASMVNAENVNGPGIYNLIMQTADIFLIFGTGTPIVKDPYELVPCINMLAGKILLPHDYNKFTSTFVGEIWSEVESEEDDLGEKIVIASKVTDKYIFPNSDYLKNRLMGFISYARSDPELFPRKLPVIVKHVPMDMSQWNNYCVQRSIENSEVAAKIQMGSGKK